MERRKYGRSMRMVLAMICLLVVGSLPGRTQNGMQDIEPSAKQLGAPVFEGAVFVRTSVGFDEAYETAMYITLVDIDMVENFFTGQLQEKRIVHYADNDIVLTAYLLRTWSSFPGGPTRTDLPRLEEEPSVQVIEYDPEGYEPLIEYYEGRPGGEEKVAALRYGRTMIKYTYERSESLDPAVNIIGSWKEASRDLPAYWGSVFEFGADGTYSITYTRDNLMVLTGNLAHSRQFEGMSADEVLTLMNSRNPETGTYNIMGTSITMGSSQPVDGIDHKIGAVESGKTLMSLELDGLPRLTFLKSTP